MDLTKHITLKEIMANRKPYPYKEVAEKLNNLQPTQLSNIDRIVAEGEQQSSNMVGIKKLFRMVTNPIVKTKMKELYNL